MYSLIVQRTHRVTQCRHCTIMFGVLDLIDYRPGFVAFIRCLCVNGQMGSFPLKIVVALTRRKNKLNRKKTKNKFVWRVCRVWESDFLLPKQKVHKHWAGADAQIALSLPLGSLLGALVLPFGSLGSPVFSSASFLGPPSPSSASLGGSPPPLPPSAVLLRCPVWCFVSSNGPFELARALLNGYSESPRG